MPTARRKPAEGKTGPTQTIKSQKPAGAITRLRARCPALHGSGERSLHQQSGRERSAYDQGTAEDLRLLPIDGRRQDLLPGSQLPVNLSQAGHVRLGSIVIAISGQKSRFHDNG